jgi:MipA family protein
MCTMPLSLLCRRANLPLRCCLGVLYVHVASAQTADSPAAPIEQAVVAKGPVLEGAVGAILGFRPEFQGASRRRFKLTPGLFLRYGRFTLSNAGGFATRRSDDVAPGLSLDMVRSDRARIGLSLRVDNGRTESSSAALKGLGNIRPTVRLRASARWQLDGPWRVGAAWSEDVLGRQGGGTGEINAGWETRMSVDTTLGLGANLGFANGRYLQNQFGITPEQSVNSGYATYSPRAGWREVALSVGARRDISWGDGERWIFIASVGASRLIGAAAASPLTTARNGWGLSVGVARQF